MPNRDSIIEIAAILWERSNEATHKRVFHELVRPSGKIPKNIRELTGITNESVAGADTIDHVLPRLRTFVGEARLIAHNAHFDRRFLEQNARLMGQTFAENEWVCTQRMAQRAPIGRPYNLADLAERLELGTRTGHRALRDCERAHSRFPGAVCRQRWTVRLGEVEPVFGQTGRVVLDITARTAHDGGVEMDKSAIDTPSREVDLRNIPVHLRTALRRALEFEARAPAPRSAEEAEQCEEQLRAIADEFFGALLTPVLQRAVRSAAVGDAASALVRHLPRRMRSDGLETVNVRTSRGTTVPVTTPYYREKHARRAKRRPGLYPALVVLGIYDRCTPKLASDASRAVAMLSSLAEAQAQLRSEGIALDIKTLRSTAYRYAARARAAQQSAACGLLDRVTGKRVVVSLDGGRVRVRRKKRGPKTKKGRNRFHTDWKEPKLLILYVVGDDGRPSQTWAPIIDGTLRGPEAVFALLLSYARQIGLNAADKVLFIADGAPWIWRRLQRLIAALGLSPTQVLGLIDFYHAAKQLSDAVKLRRWSATQRTRWLNRTRGLLKRARVDEVITALRELCRGRTAGKIRTHLNYFLKNRHRFAYTTMVGLGLPRGSGAVESAIRRVINLRIKGASIYWLPESVDAILLLRSFYKSGRWNCLQRMAMTPVGVSA